MQCFEKGEKENWHSLAKKSSRWPEQAKLGRASSPLIRNVDFMPRAREGHGAGQLCNQVHSSEKGEQWKGGVDEGKSGPVAGGRGKCHRDRDI